MDLIADDDTTGSGVMFFMDENDVRAALKHPLVMLGTDSGGMAPDSGPPTAGVHPRAWGSAARILAKYVREERLLTLEEAVRKMTSLPARRMGLWDRGVVQAGRRRRSGGVRPGDDPRPGDVRAAAAVRRRHALRGRSTASSSSMAGS